MSLLELSNVEVSYTRRGRDAVRAVAGATLDLDGGEIVGLVGESGCGKSTLARAAVGLTGTTAGSIRFDGDEITALKRRTRPRALTRLQLVFQNPYSSLNPRRRVGSQLADALSIHGLVEPRARPHRVRELLEQVGLPSVSLDAYPHQFSGGQRQRLAIARALAASPSVVILDEPLSSLDASAQAQVANLLRKLSRELGIAMLLISHDLAIVRQIADRIAVMYLGVIVETGPTESVWTHPLHPYTEALISAVPRADGEGVKPRALAGEVPDPAHPPAGCRFHPRCPYAFDRCAEESPPLIEVGVGRHAACWLQTGDEPLELTASRDPATAADGRS